MTSYPNTQNNGAGSLPIYNATLISKINTLSGGNLYGISGIPFDGSNNPALSFTTTQDISFNWLTLTLAANNPNDDGNVLVYLAGDDGSGSGPGYAGAPDLGNNNFTFIGTIPDSILPNANNNILPPVTIQIPKNPLTTKNNVWWMFCDFSDANSSAGWVYNQTDYGYGVANQLGYSDALGGTFVPGSTYDPQGDAYPGTYQMIINTTNNVMPVYVASQPSGPPYPNAQNNPAGAIPCRVVSPPTNPPYPDDQGNNNGAIPVYNMGVPYPPVTPPFFPNQLLNPRSAIPVWLVSGSL
jgi:hypothetical protein